MNINIYPAIDLINGDCVRLHQGHYHEMTSYSADPLHMAKKFALAGAKYLHVVDLDGAKQQSPQHFDIITQIAAETSLMIQTGGGIRTEQQIKNYLDKGIQRIILGSIAVSQIELVKQWFKIFGADRLVLAFDIRMNAGIPQLATHGWQENTAVSLWDILEIYQDIGLQTVLCTDIACDGTLKGPNFDLYKQCGQKYPHLKFQASGGIKDAADIVQLDQIPVDSVIVGKAIYEGKINLKEIL